MARLRGTRRVTVTIKSKITREAETAKSQRVSCDANTAAATDKAMVERRKGGIMRLKTESSA